MRALLLTASLLALPFTAQAHDLPCPAGNDYTIALHGGAGVILKKDMSDAKEREYRKAIKMALTKGSDMLSEGVQGLDVIETVIQMMEDDPKFNAGKGAVFTAAGKNELDAAIMDGRDRNAGTVAGVTTVKNPISLARAVMEKSKHVMLQSQGAENFAKENGLDIVAPDYFHTDRRWRQMKAKTRKQEGSNQHFIDTPETKYGTVGVVVRDGCGDLAAGTSTGGMTAKKWGRVGDVPIIGAGTYADNRYCAVSATGTGEYFIRATVARDICAQRQYLNMKIQDAADTIIHRSLADMGGDGGVIAIDNKGHYAFSFNTPGMYRGAVRNGDMTIGIFKDD